MSVFVAVNVVVESQRSPFVRRSESLMDRYATGY